MGILENYSKMEVLQIGILKIFFENGSFENWNMWRTNWLTKILSKYKILKKINKLRNLKIIIWD